MVGYICGGFAQITYINAGISRTPLRNKSKYGEVILVFPNFGSNQGVVQYSLADLSNQVQAL